MEEYFHWAEKVVAGCRGNNKFLEEELEKLFLKRNITVLYNVRWICSFEIVLKVIWTWFDVYLYSALCCIDVLQCYIWEICPAWTCPR